MGLKQLYKVVPCIRSEIREFIETHHYSGSINGCITDYCFKLVHLSTGSIHGALFYGRMAMANQWKKFGDSPGDVTELRRLVCIDDTPKNTESFFIGHTLRWLRVNTHLKVVVSYSDLEYEHVGTVYKASNFQFIGRSVGANVILYNNKRYHDKAIRTKYKGELKPFAKRLIQALEDGEAVYKKTKGKNTFLYELR